MDWAEHIMRLSCVLSRHYMIHYLAISSYSHTVGHVNCCKIVKCYVHLDARLKTFKSLGNTLWIQLVSAGYFVIYNIVTIII